MINKISCLTPQKNIISTKIAKKLATKTIQKVAPEALVPLVALPLISYMSTDKDKLFGKMAEEANQTKKFVTDNVRKTAEQLKDAGIKVDKNNIAKYTDNNGYANQTAKNAIRKAEKSATNKVEKKSGISFGANEEEASRQIQSEKIVGIDSEKTVMSGATADVDTVTEGFEVTDFSVDGIDLDIAQIEQIDVSMVPELETYLEMPIEDVPDGLIDSIADLVSDGADACGDVFESIKDFIENLADGV